uniref:Uncharacterized protein n=1 Tax=Anguilla anguilla TaxID=7936 RepID=A0A0E9W1Y2_ANGAN
MGWRCELCVRVCVCERENACVYYNSGSSFMGIYMYMPPGLISFVFQCLKLICKNLSQDMILQTENI